MSERNDDGYTFGAMRTKGEMRSWIDCDQCDKPIVERVSGAVNTWITLGEFNHRVEEHEREVHGG